MALSAQDVARLHRIITLAEKLIANGDGRNSKKPRGGKRIRRGGQELVRFRRMLKAERKKGVSVAKLARKHGVSTAYIYMLP